MTTTEISTLLIQPNVYGRFNGAPMSLMYLAAYIRQKNKLVSILDLVANHLSIDDMIKHLSDLQPNIVGVTSNSITHLSAIKLAQKIANRFPDCLIVKGGLHETLVPEITLRRHACIDITVRGAGEIPLLDIVEAIEDGKSPYSARGISFRHGEKILENPPAPCLDLDHLPFAARDLLPHSPYYDFEIFRDDRGIQKRTAQVLTTYGCGFNCTFCGVAGTGFKYRSAWNVTVELELLAHQGYQAVFFDDSVFTFGSLDNPNLRLRFEEICASLGKLRFEWGCQTRVDQVDDSILRIMERSGCTYIYYGMESGCPKQLDTLRKGFTIKDVERAIKKTKEHGIRPCVSVIFGLPDETEETVDTTLKMLKRCMPLVSLSVYALYPGTQAWEQARLPLDAYEKPYSRQSIWELYDEGIGAIHLITAERATDIYIRAKEVLGDLLYPQVENLILILGSGGY